MIRGVEAYIETVTVAPRYGIRAVQFPAGGLDQGRVADFLRPLGIEANLYDGAVQQLDVPAPDGSYWQWRSIHIGGVYKSAMVGDWIVVHLGDGGVLCVQTMTDETFHAIYKEGVEG